MGPRFVSLILLLLCTASAASGKSCCSGNLYSFRKITLSGAGIKATLKDSTNFRVTNKASVKPQYSSRSGELVLTNDGTTIDILARRNSVRYFALTGDSSKLTQGGTNGVLFGHADKKFDVAISGSKAEFNLAGVQATKFKLNQTGEFSNSYIGDLRASGKIQIYLTGELAVSQLFISHLRGAATVKLTGEKAALYVQRCSRPITGTATGTGAKVYYNKAACPSCNVTFRGRNVCQEVSSGRFVGSVSRYIPSAVPTAGRLAAMP